MQFGGCQINALDLAKELTRRGHQVVAFAIHDTPLISVAPLAQKLGIPLHILPAEKNPFLQARHLAGLVNDHRLDIVHVLEPGSLKPTTLALWSRPETALVVTNWTMDNFKGLPPMTSLILGTESLREEASALCAEHRCGSSLPSTRLPTSTTSEHVPRFGTSGR